MSDGDVIKFLVSLGHYRCECTSNWYGKNCTEYDCEKEPCKNGGTCSKQGCECTKEWSGLECTERARPAVSISPIQTATMSVLTNGYQETEKETASSTMVDITATTSANHFGQKKTEENNNTRSSFATSAYRIQTTNSATSESTSEKDKTTQSQTTPSTSNNNPKQRYLNTGSAVSSTVSHLLRELVNKHANLSSAQEGSAADSVTETLIKYWVEISDNTSKSAQLSSWKSGKNIDVHVHGRTEKSMSEIKKESVNTNGKNFALTCKTLNR